MAVEAFSTMRWRSHYSLRRELKSILNHALKLLAEVGSQPRPICPRYICPGNRCGTGVLEPELLLSMSLHVQPMQPSQWCAMSCFFPCPSTLFHRSSEQKNTTTSRTCGIWHIKGIGSQPSKKNKKTMTATTFWGFCSPESIEEQPLQTQPRQTKKKSITKTKTATIFFLQKTPKKREAPELHICYSGARVWAVGIVTSQLQS